MSSSLNRKIFPAADGAEAKKMIIAINTDCIKADLKSALNCISESGFHHLIWSWHWNDDYLFTPEDILLTRRLLAERELSITNIHGSCGNGTDHDDQGCGWYLADPRRRAAGVALVINRLQYMDSLGIRGALTLHVPCFNDLQDETLRKRVTVHRDMTRRSLDEVMPYLIKYDIPLALENMPHDNYEVLTSYMNDYPEEYIGLTCDTGHANIAGKTGDFYRLKSRVRALHINDNDGISDQHLIPGDGNVNWDEVTSHIAAMPLCDGKLEFELSIAAEQLPETFERCSNFAENYFPGR